MATYDTVNSNNLFGIMLFIAGLIHATLIFVIGFALPDKLNAERTLNSLDIILVHHRSEEEPEKADYLAQANNEGGGSEEQALRPSNPTSNPNITPEQGKAPQEMRAAAPEKTTIVYPKLILQKRAKQQLNNPQETKENPVEKPLTAEELVEYDMKIARLSSVIDQQLQAYAKRPKKKFVSANTKEYAPAQYLESWRKKIEHIGNLHYPKEAIRRNIYGSLRLQVDINNDGTIHNISLLESSGHQVLDDAAIRIVRKAAPFSKISDAVLKKQNDEQANVLSIVRTWQFRNKQLTTQQ